MDETELESHADRALKATLAAGFEHAQVSARRLSLCEVNVSNNEASLMRSTEQSQLSLAGIVGGRRASTTLDRLDDAEALAAAIAGLRADAESAPADEAHAVSADQQLSLVQGPQAPDVDALVRATKDWLDWRAAEAPGFRIQEGAVAHHLSSTVTLTSGGSRLATSVGQYQIGALGAATDGTRTSSFAYAGGATHDLAASHPATAFGLDRMMRDAVRSLEPKPLGRRFTGDLLLSPAAVADLLEWLLGQLGDERLISGSSVFRDRVGQSVAVPALTLSSRFDAPGVAAVSADAFVAQPLVPVRSGVLETLLPTLYGSRRTGLPHRPAAADGGWAVDAGATPLDDLVAGVREGAWIGRFSMGRPAASGDFSGVVKNGFLIEDGRVGRALAETMVSGNMAAMLNAITGISRERIDFGAWLLPWIRVSGMHFS